MGKKGYKSVYGKPIRTIDYLLRDIEEKLSRDLKILIVDDFDGVHSLYCARKNHKVDCYETIYECIYGGNINGFTTYGINERINYYNLDDNIRLFQTNFYENRVEREYDFVFSYKSLNLDRNSHIPKERKVRKLKSSVKENGYLYIWYVLADNEKDYLNFPTNQYFRRGEMRTLFDESWEIIYLNEYYNKTKEAANPINDEVHYQRMGHLFARKKYKKRQYKYHYNVYTPDDYSEFYKKK